MGRLFWCGSFGETAPYFITFGIVQRGDGLRRSLRPPHGPGLIGEIDALIAATAPEYRWTLDTTNADFTRVPVLALIRLDRGTSQPVSGSGPTR